MCICIGANSAAALKHAKKSSQSNHLNIRKHFFLTIAKQMNVRIECYSSIQVVQTIACLAIIMCRFFSHGSENCVRIS